MLYFKELRNMGAVLVRADREEGGGTDNLKANRYF